MPATTSAARSRSPRTARRWSSGCPARTAPRGRLRIHARGERLADGEPAGGAGGLGWRRRGPVRTLGCGLGGWLGRRRRCSLRGRRRHRARHYLRVQPPGRRLGRADDAEPNDQRVRSGRLRPPGLVGGVVARRHVPGGGGDRLLVLGPAHRPGRRLRLELRRRRADHGRHRTVDRRRRRQRGHTRLVGGDAERRADLRGSPVPPGQRRTWGRVWLLVREQHRGRLFALGARLPDRAERVGQQPVRLLGVRRRRRRRRRCAGHRLKSGRRVPVRARVRMRDAADPWLLQIRQQHDAYRHPDRPLRQRTARRRGRADRRRSGAARGRPRGAGATARAPRGCICVPGAKWRLGPTTAPNATLQPADTASNDSFGTSVALSSDGGAVAIGGPGDDASLGGEADVFEGRSVTSPTCQPGSVGVGQPTTCTSTVTDDGIGEATPTGRVSLTTDSSGSFGGGASCTLSQNTAGTSSCQVTYTPSAANSGSHVLTASYSGDDEHASGNRPDPGRDQSGDDQHDRLMLAGAGGGRPVRGLYRGRDRLGCERRTADRRRQPHHQRPGSILGDHLLTAAGVGGDRDLHVQLHAFCGRARSPPADRQLWRRRRPRCEPGVRPARRRGGIDEHDGQLLAAVSPGRQDHHLQHHRHRRRRGRTVAHGAGDVQEHRRRRLRVPAR